MKSGCNSTPEGSIIHVCAVMSAVAMKLSVTFFKGEKTTTLDGQVQTTDCSPTGFSLAAFFGGDFVLPAVYILSSV